MSNSHTDLDFIRDMLVMALNEKRDDIVSDLFKMYEKYQNPPTIPTGDIDIDSFTKPDGTEYNFTLTSDCLSEMGDFAVGNSLNNDVISFGDYKPRDGF